MPASLLHAESPVSLLAPERPRRVLLIAYSFPPVGGAGVQRPSKWVKYLRRMGWETTVLTPANPSVPVLDESLLADIPPETRILRARTLEPDYRIKQQVAATANQSTTAQRSWRSLIGNSARTLIKTCLQPDPQILWYPQALAMATQELKRVSHDIILCTAPPFSSFLLGRKLKRRFQLPLVLDYRDEWDLSSQYLEQAQRDRFSHWVQERQQRSVLRAADAVVATTQSSLHRLEARAKESGCHPRMTCIYNGYDAEDFVYAADKSAIDVAPTSPGKFRLVYTGTLWNLTNIEPLVAAVERLQQSSPRLLPRLEFVCIGRKTPEQRSILARLESTGSCLRNIDYCHHSAALAWVKSADGLCLLLSQVPGAERVVPAKLFEYLAAEKDLLAIAPAGETADIAQSIHQDAWRTPDDIPGIAQWLAQRLANGPSNCSNIDDDRVQEFSRESQTARLADLLESLISSPAVSAKVPNPATVMTGH